MQFVDNEFQALEFGKEVRLVVGQGVAGAQAGDKARGIHFHFLRTHRHAGTGEQIIDAYRTQVRAFSCHVGAGDDDEERAFLHVDVVAHTTVAMHQGMSQSLCTEYETGIAAGICRTGFPCIGRDAGFGGSHISLVKQSRISICRMIIGKGCQ